MHFDLSKAAPREIYHLMIGLVTPRPIALVTSKSLEGHLNAAPFSAYNYLGVDPPIVAIGVANRPGPGVVGKDTARNVRHTREFVINVVNEEIVEKMNICAVDFPPEVRGRAELHPAVAGLARAVAPRGRAEARPYR